MRFTPFVVAVALAFACDRAPTAPDPEPAPPPTLDQTATGQVDEERTPFQRSIMEAVAARQAQGLPVARVTYEYEEAAMRAPFLMAAGAAGPPTVISATTVLRFDNPTQAGFQEWPALVVEGDVPEGAEGFVNEGDYTEFLKETIAKQYPDAWTGVEYETGPRTYTVTESIVMEPTPGPGALALLGLQQPTALTTAEGLLMGFTILGPNIDYHVEWDLTVCIIWFFGCQVEWEIFDFWAGLKLDWTIGTRLPMNLRLTSDDPVLEGSTFAPTTAATGEDWDAPEYEAAGVAPLDGDEFALEFILKAGVFVEISGADVVNLGVDIEVDEGANFTTPLGVGQMIVLPSVLIPVWGIDVGVASFDLGVSLTPEAGSDKFTAGWLASAEGSGSGNVTYTTSNVDIPLGTVHANDGPGNAVVELSGFQYYFNQFVLDLGAFISLEVLSWGHTWIIPVTDFDLSALTGGLYVGVHSGTPGTLDLAIPIENVAPTVTLSHAGTVMIRGEPTFLARSGQFLAFTGEATDPGLDDLTLTWDFDDGPPVPDASTVYPQPFQVTESQAHGFSNACLYEVGLTATDDDLAAGEDHVPVIVTGGAANSARLEGYWQHQFGRMGATDFDDAALDCYLGVVAQLSAVFGEVRELSSIARAYRVLFMQQNGGSPLEQFDRELLVLWLNFAHGAFGYTDLVDTNGDRVAETPFADAVAAAETARLNPFITPQRVKALTQMLHRISQAAMS
jgi:hypothetical protein